jgi:hypothetical protein
MLSYSLKKLNISFFGFEANLLIKDNLIKRIIKISPPDKDGDSNFIEQSKINNYNQFSYVWLSGFSKGNNEFIFNFASRPGKTKTKAGSISELIDILSENKDEIIFSCHLIFNYRNIKNIKPIIRLPLIISEHPDSKFVEIRGIHIRNTKEPTEEAILDLSSDDGLQASIYFQNKTTISKTLIDNILDYGLNFSKTLVYQELRK